jgi:hypothetical protein
VKGSCHCGAVRFEVTGEVRRASVCHCSQCRRQSGGAWASATVATGDLSVTGEVRWFKASDEARRGLCPTCGAFLFWEAEGSGEIAVALGAVDGPTGLRDLRDIFVPETPPRHVGPIRDACLCGAVTVTLGADPGPVTACHCTQCRKTSGHVPLSLDDPGRRARIEGEVATFTSPGGAVRSFCPTCGTKIAFDGPTGLLSLEMGLFDQLAGRAPDLHIFTAFKGDYYEIPDGVPAYPRAGPD